MRILVVEDERRVANFVCRALRENSYAVDLADTGEKALEMASETHTTAFFWTCDSRA